MVQNQIERGAFGIPKPQGWTIERIVSLMAGVMILITQIVRSDRSNIPRIFAGWVGANLVLNAVAGWCPASVVLHRLGFPTAAERALVIDGDPVLAAQVLSP